MSKFTTYAKNRILFNIFFGSKKTQSEPTQFGTDLAKLIGWSMAILAVVFALFFFSAMFSVLTDSGFQGGCLEYVDGFYYQDGTPIIGYEDMARLK
jgi:hypothetical protein